MIYPINKFFKLENEKEDTPKTSTPSPKPTILSSDHPEYVDLEIYTSVVEELKTQPFNSNFSNKVFNEPYYTFSNEQSIDHILQPSNNLIKNTLEPYIKDLDLKLFNPETDSQNQSYTTLDHITYTLKDEEHLNGCYNIISNLTNYGSLSTFITQYSPVLKKDPIMDQIDQVLNDPDFLKLKGNFLGYIKNTEPLKKTLQVLLTKVVLDKLIPSKNQYTNESIANNENDNTSLEENCSISLQDFSLSVGSGIANLYLNEKIVFNFAQTDARAHKEHNKYYYKALRPKLQAIYYLYNTNSYTISKLKEDILPHTFENEIETEACFNLLHQSLLESGFGGGNLYQSNIFKPYEIVKKASTLAILQDGSLLINFLVEKGLLTLTTSINKNIPSIIFSENLSAELTASATFFKPYLSLYNKFDLSYFFISYKFVMFYLTLKLFFKA